MAKADKAAPVKYYRLRRKFFNGKMMCEAGSIQPFPEGNQPRKAVLVSSEELKAEAVMKEDAQDVYIAKTVENHLANILPDLVAEAVEAALAEAEEVVTPTATLPPVKPTK